MPLRLNAEEEYQAALVNEVDLDENGRCRDPNCTICNVPAEIPTSAEWNEITNRVNTLVVQYGDTSTYAALPSTNPQPETSMPANASTPAVPTQTETAPRRTRCRCCHQLRPRRNITSLNHPLRVYRNNAPYAAPETFDRYDPPRARVCTNHVNNFDIVRCGSSEHDSPVDQLAEGNTWTPPQGCCGNWIQRSQVYSVSSRLFGLETITNEYRMVCADCRNAVRATIVCSACGVYTSDANSSEARGSGRGRLCSFCAENYYECADCRRVRPTREHRAAWVNAQGQRVCNYCNDHYFICAGCSGREHTDSQSMRGYCLRCTPDLNAEDFPWERQIDNRCLDQEMQEFRGDATRLSRTKNSRRRFGVELEYAQSSRLAARHLCDKFGWGAKPDGTAGVVQEFVSPPMYGDVGIGNVEDFCERAAKCALQVSKSCGYHLHVDVSSERKIALSRIACAYQTFLPLWRCFVPPSRRANRFCNEDHGNGTPEQIAQGSVKPFELSRTRYSAINWQSYHRHRTVENRLHTGTMSATKVTSWIRANLAFVEWSRRLPFADILQYWRAPVTQQLEALRAAGVWDDELVSFYKQRAHKFGVDLNTSEVLNRSSAPASPDDPNWVWEDDDYRRTRRWLGLPAFEALQAGEMVDAWRAGVLTRQAGPSGTAFDMEIGVPLIRGYRENMEELDP